VGSKVTDLSVSGQQDLLLSASRKGDTILHLRRASCFSDAFRLFISDRTGGGAYVSRELTDQANLRDFRRDQAFQPVSYLSLSPDGRSIVGVSGDGRRFLQSTRSSLTSTDFSVPIEGAFDAVNASITSSGAAVLADPLLSGDGLGLYYHVINDPGSNGLYESSRRTTNDKFSAGVKLPDFAQQYQSIKGVSADRLTLFVFDTNTAPWSTTILKRKDASFAWSNPNAPNAAPAIQGFRSTPVDDCSLLVGNFTTTGCLDEDIFFFSAQ
jgi:hypothetical protein